MGKKMRDLFYGHGNLEKMYNTQLCQKVNLCPVQTIIYQLYYKKNHSHGKPTRVENPPAVHTEYELHVAEIFDS